MKGDRRDHRRKRELGAPRSQGGPALFRQALHSDGAESQRGWDWKTIAIMLLGLLLASTAVSELWTWSPWR